jgi:LmbE family N-acetylglucosaminyl deacetylase
MRVLIVAPHPDDEVLGCGGTIARHAAQGDEVFVHLVGNRVINHTRDEAYIRQTLDQARRAAKVLGVTDLRFSDLPDEQLDNKLIDLIVPMEEYVVQLAPDAAYVPNETDSDQDHRAVAWATRVSCRGVARVLAYEVMGPTRGFAPTTYVDITPHLAAKIEAMRIYEGEVRPFPHPRSPEAITALARTRGVEAGVEAAEAFRLIREVLP